MKTTKLICISVYNDQLILYNVYNGKSDETETKPQEGWYVEWQDNQLFWFPLRCFMFLSEWRDCQIDSILED